MGVTEIVRMKFLRERMKGLTVKNGIFVPHFKKGDGKSVYNYRVVCLLSMRS